MCHEEYTDWRDCSHFERRMENCGESCFGECIFKARGRTIHKQGACPKCMALTARQKRDKYERDQQETRRARAEAQKAAQRYNWKDDRGTGRTSYIEPDLVEPAMRLGVKGDFARYVGRAQPQSQPQRPPQRPPPARTRGTVSGRKQVARQVSQVSLSEQRFSDLRNYCVSPVDQGKFDHLAR